MRFTLIMPLIIFVSLITALIVKSFIALPVNEIGGRYEQACYVNDYFQVKYNFPDRFSLEDYSTIQNENEKYKASDGTTGYPYNETEKYTIYQDSCIINNLIGTKIETYFVPKKENRVSKSRLLKQQIELCEKENGCKLSKKYTSEIAKRKFKMALLKSKDNDFEKKYLIAICKKDKSYYIIKISNSDYDEKTPEEYFDFFVKATK